MEPTHDLRGEYDSAWEEVCRELSDARLLDACVLEPRGDYDLTAWAALVKGTSLRLVVRLKRRNDWWEQTWSVYDIRNGWSHHGHVLSDVEEWILGAIDLARRDSA